jgi:hypothetical protein
MGGSEVIFYLGSIDEGEWSVPCPGRFTLGESPGNVGGAQNRSGRCGEAKNLLFRSSPSQNSRLISLQYIK